VAIGYQEVTPISTVDGQGYPKLRFTVTVNSFQTVTPQTTVPDGYTGMYTATDLYNIRNNLATNYILMNDIDISSYSNWVSPGEIIDEYGTSYTPFSGIFDGNGHTINGLTANTDKQVALFGSVGSAGNIKNVKLINTNIVSTSNIGGICITNSGTIDNCYVSGGVHCLGYSNCGGITPYNAGSIIHCTSEAIVTCTDNYAGGITGYNSGIITDCETTGAITSQNSYAGGIAGSNYHDLESCYATGDITGSNYVGGIAGYNNSNLSNCYSTGNIELTSGYYVGGIAGYCNGSLATQCFSKGIVSAVQVNGTCYVGGLFGYSSTNEIALCFSESNVSVDNTDVYSYVGGLIGFANNTILHDSYAHGEVNGKYAGGLVGFCNTEVRNCYSCGNVIKSDYSGGLTGVLNGLVTSCYYDSIKSGQDDTGKGDPKTTVEMQQQATFVDWDFETVWEMPLFSGGSGTEEDPYLIANITDLLATEPYPYPEKHYRQIADIDLAGIEWIPMGGRVGPYLSGTHDGNGYKIINLYVPAENNTGGGGGIWGQLQGATVKNLTVVGDVAGSYAGLITGYFEYGNIENCNILGILRNGDFGKGGLVGLISSEGNATIINCTSKVTIELDEGENHTGGLIGYVGNISYEVEIKNCLAIVDFVGIGEHQIGGFIGRATGGANTIIENCYAEANAKGVYIIGGFAGEVDCTIRKCYSIGSVRGECRNGSGHLIGGFAGRLSTNSDINDCYSLCSVELTNPDWPGHIGGFAGESNGVTNCYSTGSVVRNGPSDPELSLINKGGFVGLANNTTISCYYDSETSGQSDDDGRGTPKTTTEMKTQSTFVDWDFISIWKLSSITDGYPALQWQEGTDEVVPVYPPVSRILLRFRSGDSEPYPMGYFFIDRTQFVVGQPGLKINARNSIGKYLKDQTFNERNIFSTQDFNLIVAQILINAGITNYYVGTETLQVGIEFKPNQALLDGLNELLKYVRNWQIREEASGRVVVAERTDPAFSQPGKYTFYRNRDIFSRQVTIDDNDAYSRVCCHTSDFSVAVYRAVPNTLGWLTVPNKTHFEPVPDGTTVAEAAALATEIADFISNSGQVEEFDGPFRPHLQPGDQAEIIDVDGPRLVGVITTVQHDWDKGGSGFITGFTADYGGKVGKPMLRDFIDQLLSSKNTRTGARKL